MAFLSALALVMLTLMGYSSGITLAGTGKDRTPTILDLIFIAGLWVAMFTIRDRLGRGWTIIAGIVGGLAVAGIYTTLIRPRFADKAEEPLPNLSGMNPLRQLWERWKHFAEKLGAAQGRLLMGFFYFLIVTPFGIIMSLLSDPLNRKQPFTQSGWSPFQNSSVTLEEGKKQY